MVVFLNFLFFVLLTCKFCLSPEYKELVLINHEEEKKSKKGWEFCLFCLFSCAVMGPFGSFFLKFFFGALCCVNLPFSPVQLLLQFGYLSYVFFFFNFLWSKCILIMLVSNS